MTYVFDTSSFIVLGHFFPERFPSFWERLDAAVSEGTVVSVREVRRELGSPSTREHLSQWVKRNGDIFLKPSEVEMAFVAEVFQFPRFQHLVGERQRLRGTPVADPFVIACAKVTGGCVVTEERLKENAAKIPNVCKHFAIDCTNLEGFMARQGWEF